MSSIITKAPSVGRQITEIELAAWIGQAAPGDILEYHRGFLVLDIMSRGSRLSPPDRAELCLVARRAWWASERGLVHLLQRRHGTDDYSYLAVARPKPMKALVSLSTLLLTEAA